MEHTARQRAHEKAVPLVPQKIMQARKQKPEVGLILRVATSPMTGKTSWVENGHEVGAAPSFHVCVCRIRSYQFLTELFPPIKRPFSKGNKTKNRVKARKKKPKTSLIPNGVASPMTGKISLIQNGLERSAAPSFHYCVSTI